MYHILIRAISDKFSKCSYHCCLEEYAMCVHSVVYAPLFSSAPVIISGLVTWTISAENTLTVFILPAQLTLMIQNYFRYQ